MTTAGRIQINRPLKPLDEPIYGLSYDLVATYVVRGGGRAVRHDRRCFTTGRDRHLRIYAATTKRSHRLQSGHHRVGFSEIKHASFCPCYLRMLCDYGYKKGG